MKNVKRSPKADQPTEQQPPAPKVDKFLGKKLDVAKEALATVSSVADVFQEKERTRQAEERANADVFQAKEETARRQIAFMERQAELVVDDRKNARDHEHAMQVLADQRTLDAARIRQQDRVLDRMLGNPAADTPQLAQSLKALLSRPDGG